MKGHFLVGIAILGCAVYAGLAVQSIGSQSTYCPYPSAASVTALFAPCQAFDSAMGHAISKSEAVWTGLLTPDEQPLLVTTQFASREFDPAHR